MCFLSLSHFKIARAYESTTRWGLWVPTITFSYPPKNVLRDISKLNCLQYRSPTYPTRNTSRRHESTSYLWVAQVHRMHDKQLNFKLSHFESVDRSPSSFNDGTKYLKCQCRHVHFVIFFFKQQGQKELFSLSVLIMVKVSS